MKRLHISSLIVIGAVATLFASVAPAAPVEEAPSAPSKEFACSKDKSCPMQKWMRANMGAPVAAEDWAGIISGLKIIKANAPPGFPDWASDAAGCIAIAEKKDMAALKTACDTCHKTHKAKEKYKDEMRDTPWPK